MKDTYFKIIFINRDYLRELYNVDTEINFVDSADYDQKPHLGILIENSEYKYVIPLTSAKDKHKTWDDVTSYNYRIYEVIDIRTTKVEHHHKIVPIKNKQILKNVNAKDQIYYKQRILSVLEIRKMFPIKEGVYEYVDLNISTTSDVQEINRRILLNKEYQFCLRRKDDIIAKANKIYKKQVSSFKVLHMHCNYKKLEQACENYSLNSRKLVLA